MSQDGIEVSVLGCTEAAKSEVLVEDTRPPRLPSSSVHFYELIALTCFNFPYGLIVGTFGLWILPAEAQRLFPLTQSLTLGLSLGIVGVTQLICPIAGKVSDLHQSSTDFGKRSPYIVWGSVVAVISTLGMWKTSLQEWGWLYYFFLFTGMTGLNIAYSVDCGLVPDVLDEDAQGKSSGLVAVHTLFGSGIGFGLVVLTADRDFHFIYLLYIILVGLACLLTCIVARRLERRRDSAPLRLPTSHPLSSQASEESMSQSTNNLGNSGRHMQGNSIYPSEEEARGIRAPSFDGGQLPLRRLSSLQLVTPHDSIELRQIPDRQDRQTQERPIPDSLNRKPRHYHDPQNVSTTRAPKLTARDIADAFRIDVSESYDFFWVFLGRALYYVGVSVQAFMLYYLRDVVGTESDADRRFQIGCIALLAQAMAACVAYPVGKLTDENPNIKRKKIIYLACLCMSSVYIGFLFSPLFGKWGFEFILCCAALYGMGNGCFLAVDYALALATIPKKENTTQALGIWGVAAFIGSSVGPLLWGVIIEAFGREPGSGNYHFSGYVAMLFGGIAATVGAGVVIKMVENVE